MKKYMGLLLTITVSVLLTNCSSASDTAITITSTPSLTFVSNLHNDVRESSGLAEVNGKTYTHNDSGNAALLYEINTSTGDVVRTIIINGATNVDWEDLAYDDTYLYIADTGNNLGSRTDLKIYKVLKSDIATKAMVDAEEILFSYADQTTFDYASYTTPYDAEALIAYNGQLYLFTKNWADNTSKIYNIPTAPGNYVVTSVTQKTFDVMITGAAIDNANNSVALVGYANPYNSITPFKKMIIMLSGFTGEAFFSGKIAKYTVLESQGFIQLEAILFNTSTQLYLSAESLTVQSVEQPARLYKVEF